MTKERLIERIEGIVGNYPVLDSEAKSSLKKSIEDLVNRVQFPSNYCQKCEGRMFFNMGTMICEDCENVESIAVVSNVPQGQTSANITPGVVLPAHVPPVKTPKKGQKVFSGGTPAEAIRNALSAADGGEPANTNTEKVPGGASTDVNWV